jgi:hypothetical protein
MKTGDIDEPMRDAIEIDDDPVEIIQPINPDQTLSDVDDDDDV